MEVISGEKLGQSDLRHLFQDLVFKLQMPQSGVEMDEVQEVGQ
jgi:hypothetical protein